jgi:hypothetical protein
MSTSPSTVGAHLRQVGGQRPAERDVEIAARLLREFTRRRVGRLIVEEVPHRVDGDGIDQRCAAPANAAAVEATVGAETDEAVGDAVPHLD